MSFNGSIDHGVVGLMSPSIEVDFDSQRFADYRAALDFYEGAQWDERPRGKETRLVVNYARSVLRKAVTNMFHEPPTFTVINDAGEQTDASLAAHDILAAIYEHNALVELDPDSALDAAVLGDGAFKVTWSPASKQVIVAGVDVQGLAAWWHPTEPTKLLRVIERSELTYDELDEAEYPRPQQIRAATSPADTARVTVLEEWTAERWRVQVDGELVSDRPNPYGWVPYSIFPNERRPHHRWGQSDLVDLMEVCRELNRRMSTVGAILTMSGAPVAVIENVTGTENIRNEPGQIWELPEASKAYLLDMLAGGGVQLHIDYLDRVWRALHDLSETPRTSFGDSGKALSGVALEVEVQPLIQKVGRKRRVWERVYQERNRMCLDLAERFGKKEEIGGLRRTRVEWGAITPTDRVALVNEVRDRIQHGTLSRRAGAETLGTEDAVAMVEEWMSEAERIGQQAARQAQQEQEGRDGDAGSDQDAG